MRLDGEECGCFWSLVITCEEEPGVGTLVVKTRNNRILGERVGGGVEELHSNISISLLNIMIHPKLLSNNKCFGYLIAQSHFLWK